MQFFRNDKRVGAGNAVRIGDSGAAVTGYEIPLATQPFRERAGEGGKVGQPRKFTTFYVVFGVKSRKSE